MKHQNLLIRKVENLKRKEQKHKRKRNHKLKSQQPNVKKKNHKARVNKKTLLSHHSLSSILQQIYQFNLLFKRLSLQSKLI